MDITLGERISTLRIQKEMAQSVKFVKTVNRFRRRHKNWKLVEVNSADGEHIEIRL